LRNDSTSTGNFMTEARTRMMGNTRGFGTLIVNHTSIRTASYTGIDEVLPGLPRR
jgi:hypothetical protein